MGTRHPRLGDEPAVSFFDGVIFKIFGESRIYIQLFTSLLFGMTSVVTYLIGKTLWDEDAGFYAGILLLGIPYLIVQTPLMLLDVHTMFFLTLSIYLNIRAVEAGGIGRTIAAACAIFVASFCKYSVWPMLMDAAKKILNRRAPVPEEKCEVALS